MLPARGPRQHGAAAIVLPRPMGAHPQPLQQETCGQRERGSTLALAVQRQQRLAHGARAEMAAGAHLQVLCIRHKTSGLVGVVPGRCRTWCHDPCCSSLPRCRVRLTKGKSCPKILIGVWKVNGREEEGKANNTAILSQNQDPLKFTQHQRTLYK